jgi:hypothetical protein
LIGSVATLQDSRRPSRPACDLPGIGGTIITLEGWLYLAVILDLFGRKVVGWKLAETLEAELVVMAFENALMMRQPIRACTSTPQGSRYSSEAVKTSLAVMGANLSMSSRGNWAKDDREKTELIPGKETHSRSEKSLADFIASILRGHGIVEQSQDLQTEEKPPDEMPPDCLLSMEQKPELSPTVLALRHAWFDVRCVSALVLWASTASRRWFA